MSRKYVTCPNGHRNDRTGGRRNCAECGKSLRKLPQQKHKLILAQGYAPFVQAAEEIHGVTDESCCACGKPRSQDRHHDRDHDHTTGRPRGLLCPGDAGCNVLIAKWVTAATAHGIAKVKRQAGESDAERWALIEAYLWRVEKFYRLRNFNQAVTSGGLVPVSERESLCECLRLALAEERGLLIVALYELTSEELGQLVEAAQLIDSEGCEILDALDKALVGE